MPHKKPIIDSRPTVAAKEAIFPGQHEGEAVAFMFRQHPMVMRKSLIFGMLAICLSIVPLDFPAVYTISSLSNMIIKVDIFVLAAVVLFWFYRWCLWYYSCYVVTVERIVSIQYQTFFKREVRALFHGRVHGMDYTIGGLQGYLLGYGNILVYTEVGNFPINHVPHPEQLHERILEVIRDNRDRYDDADHEDEEYAAGQREQKS